MQPNFLFLLLFVVGVVTKSKCQDLKNGDWVFYRMLEYRIYAKTAGAHHAIYRLQNPVYVVGIYNKPNPNYDIVEVDARYFLYTCSDLSEEWIKSPSIILEKMSNKGELESIEQISTNKISTHKRKTYEVNPFNNEVVKYLTKNQITEDKSSCINIKAKNAVAKPSK